MRLYLSLVAVLLVSFAHRAEVTPLFFFNFYDDATLNQITARFYTGNTIDQYVDVSMKNVEQLMDRSEFLTTRKTVFLIHGFTESVSAPSVITMVNAYLNANLDVNLVVIDWGLLAGGNYVLQAIPNAKKVGDSTALKIKAMVDKGLKINMIHLVGHSLGGHVAGFAGKGLIGKYGLKLNRITALDPAGPAFYPLPSLNRLDASDANIVDAILSDPKQYGYPASIGTVNFWPNPGLRVQPGCPRIPEDISMSDDESFCSHRRSWMYWSESLSKRDAFQAYNKDDKTNAIMGEFYDGSKRGDFRLITNSQSPFGKGADGIIE